MSIPNPEKVLSLTDEQAEKLVRRAKRKAALVEVLDRGIVNDRLRVELPDDLHGEWVSDNPEAISEMEVKGFKIDRTYAKKRALHNDGTSEIGKVGDTIFMTCDKETHELIEEIRQEKSRNVNGNTSARIRNKQREEKEFAANFKNSGITPIIDDDESTERVITGSEISAAVKAGSDNSQP